jgi:hypothetical protein
MGLTAKWASPPAHTATKILENDRMRKRYLLTGAGFTRNFGAPLADQIWALILSHVDEKTAPSLRARLLQEFDFEAVYQQVMAAAMREEQEALHSAVREAYRIVDDIVLSFKWVQGARYPVCLPMVQKLIGAFAENGSEPGLFFTLNQDLFIERHYYNGPTLSMPGIPMRAEWFSSTFRQPLGPALDLRLPSQQELQSNQTLRMRSGFYYIKLHGSCNWQSANGQSRMVLGQGKSQQIEGEPLLARYFDLFKNALGSNDTRLLVIGYGFGDAHINSAIADTIAGNGLELFVLSPQPPAKFKDDLERRERGPEIWKGIVSYFQINLADLFPTNQEVTAEWRYIQRRFFERENV